MNNVPFSQLMELARQDGQTEARAEFLEQFRDYLQHLANHCLGPKFRARIGHSDIVQSAMIAAYKDLPSCRARDEAQFHAWLRRILLNCISNKIRYMTQAKRDIRCEERRSSWDPVVGFEGSPSELASQGEDRERLNKALGKLPEELQVVIRLRNQEGLTFSEIGRKMERTEDAARMLWNRSIQKLAVKLKERDV